MDNALRRKRKFSDMMSNSISITQGILNNSIYYNNKNLCEIPESLFSEAEFSNDKNFETKRRKTKNISGSNDSIYKFEKDFGELKIHKLECANGPHLKLQSEFSNENKSLLLNNDSNKSNYHNNKKNESKSNLLRKKSKYEVNPCGQILRKDQNSITNREINSLNQFANLINSEEINKINNLENTAFTENNNNNKENNKDNREIKSKNFSRNRNKKEDCMNIEDSFNEYAIDIDISEFKNQPNNQNFFNSELPDLDTVNTSRNSYLDDLSLSFLTEFSNKNVSGNIISNAIETEKLMMKLFDVCNPALQPTEKYGIIE
jgi:hypothetical protein